MDNPYSQNKESSNEDDQTIRYMENVKPFGSEDGSEDDIQQNRAYRTIDEENNNGIVGDHLSQSYVREKDENVIEKGEDIEEKFREFQKFLEWEKNQKNGRQQQQKNSNGRRQRQKNSNGRRQRQKNSNRRRPRNSCFRFKFLSTIIGIVALGLLVWFAIAGQKTSKNILFHSYRFDLQNEGVRPHPSINVTEQELLRGLVDDIPLTRLAIDLKEHIKENPWRTCMCMHHLAFNVGKNSKDITPRRFCVVYNKKRGESEIMVNPIAIGRSRDSSTFLQKSRGCSKSDLPARVQRPQQLWIEWGDMILNYEKPKEKRMRKNYARFTGQDAACLALILEEMDGEVKCEKVNQNNAFPSKSNPKPLTQKVIRKDPEPKKMKVKTIEEDEIPEIICKNGRCPSDHR